MNENKRRLNRLLVNLFISHILYTKKLNVQIMVSMYIQSKIAMCKV